MSSLPQRSFLKLPVDDTAKTIAGFEQQIMRSMMVPADLVRAELGSGYAAGVEMQRLEARRVEQERAACEVEEWLLEEGLDTGVLRSSFPAPGWAGGPPASFNYCCTIFPVIEKNLKEAESRSTGSLRSSMVAAMRDKEDDRLMGKARLIHKGIDESVLGKVRQEHAAKEVEDWLLGNEPVTWADPEKLDPVADLKKAIKDLCDFPRQVLDTAKRHSDQMDALNAAFRASGGT